MLLKRGMKKIVYLDQNWLSDLTKAHLAEDTRVDKAYYVALFQALERAITEGKIVCPTASFHESESNLSTKLNTAIRNMDDSLSRGLSFNPSHDICHEQLVEAANALSSESMPARPWWALPFNQDPDSPDSASLLLIGGIKVLLTLQLLVDEDRRIRTKVSTPMYKKYKESRIQYGLNYEDEVTCSRIQILLENYYAFNDAESILRQGFPDWNPILAEVFSTQRRRFVEIGKLCDKAEGIETFLWSPEFSNAPFFVIRAKLMASDIVFAPERRPENSLLADFDIAATIVPYADVFLTEHYLAELLRKTKVAEGYGCRVFTMRQKEEVLQYFAGL